MKKRAGFEAEQDMWVVYMTGSSKFFRRGEHVPLASDAESPFNILACLGSSGDCSIAYRKWREIKKMEEDFDPHMRRGENG